MGWIAYPRRMILFDSQQPSVWSSVLPVITLIVGWALGFLTELWKGSRDSAAKALERREARLLRRHEFQRENLEELQKATTDMLNVTIEAYRGELAPASSRAYWPGLLAVTSRA